MKYSKTNPPLICMQSNSKCYRNTTTMPIKGILWHSTGANNPTLKRYIQPAEGVSNYNYLITRIGVNPNGNDYNHATNLSTGLNAWVGKAANGDVIAVQSMPWNYRPWGCGSGRNGSCNTGWIQFEICESSLSDPVYFKTAYKEACELTAYLCKIYNLNPYGTVNYNGVQVPVILCHKDANNLGLGSNHGDIYHWFNKHGKTMQDVRNDVYALLYETPAPAPKPEVEEEEEVTQEQFNTMMNNWVAEQAKKPATWETDMEWAMKEGFIQGDEHGETSPKKFMTRGEVVTVLKRMFDKVAKK